MYFKVITKKICIVEADDIEEAKDKAVEDDFVEAREAVVEATKLTSSQIRRLSLQLMED